jgi:hypothetical protein
MITWLAERDRVDLGVALASSVFTLGGSWVLRSFHARVPARAGRPVQEAQKPGESTALLDALAAVVLQQWGREAIERGLSSPDPILVRWSGTHLPVGTALREVTGGAEKLSRAARYGDVSTVADGFMHLPFRRLVVIGDPGAGKTSLAVLAVCEMLRLRRPSDPVPVLVSASSWSAREQHFDDWLVSRLRELYPLVMAYEADFDGDAATYLVRRGLIMPIVDGLDEIDPGPTEADPTARSVGTRTTAIESLNLALVAGRQIIVTCRIEQYQQMVASGGQPLSQAAVVELQPVRPAEAAEYLPLGQIDGARRWAAVTAHLVEKPEGTLGSVLATPLMVYLARTAYRDKDPTELTRFTSHSELEQHILRGYVPALYLQLPVAQDGSTRIRRRYPAPSAGRWLEFLAIDRRKVGFLESLLDGCLDSLNPFPFSPVDARAHMFGTAEVVFGLVAFLAYSRGHGLVVGGLLGIFYLLLADHVLTQAQPIHVLELSPDGRPHLMMRAIPYLLLRSVSGGGTGLVVGLLVAQFTTARAAFVVGASSAVAYVIGAVLVGALPSDRSLAAFRERRAERLGARIWGYRWGRPRAGRRFGQRAEDEESPPGSFLDLFRMVPDLLTMFEPAAPRRVQFGRWLVRIGRRAILLATAVCSGVVAGLLFDGTPALLFFRALSFILLTEALYLVLVESSYWLTHTVAFRTDVNWRLVRPSNASRRERVRKLVFDGLLALAFCAGFGASGGVGPACAAALVALIWISPLRSQWRYWSVRAWLALHRLMPWRLRSFLIDAGHRGILRPNGTEFEFRHIEIENFLAAAWNHRASASGSSHTTTPYTRPEVRTSVIQWQEPLGSAPLVVGRGPSGWAESDSLAKGPLAAQDVRPMPVQLSEPDGSPEMEGPLRDGHGGEFDNE